MISLSDERIAQLTEEAQKFSGKVLSFPGKLRARLKHLGLMARAARGDVAELVKTPFHDEPSLTHDEIARFGERVAFLRWTESNRRRFQGARKEASERFEVLAPEARGHVNKLLRALDVRYRNDPAGRKRLSAIRAGEGDTDLVQDVSDVLAESKNAEDFLARCPRGESAALARLREMLPELSALLDTKGPSATPVDARKLRDVAFSLVTLTERRLRSAADYWYDGDRFKPYAAFVDAGTPRENDEDAPDEDSTDDPSPGPVTTLRGRARGVGGTGRRGGLAAQCC